MNTVWQLEDAKNSLEHLIENALNHQQQVIQLENKQKVVVLSFDDVVKKNKPPLGAWLVNNMSDIGELSLPNRNEIEREIPFQI